jgi:hypothetical protein
LGHKEPHKNNWSLRNMFKLKKKDSISLKIGGEGGVENSENKK